MAKEYTPEKHQEWLKSLYSIPAGAAMILEDPNGRLLVVKASYRSYWTLPGGVIDEGESPKQATLREVNEEIGLAIQPDEAEFMGVAYRRNGAFLDTYQFTFKASLSQEMVDAIVLGEPEIEGYALVTKEEVKKGDRSYALVITNWANGSVVYYDEQAT